MRAYQMEQALTADVSTREIKAVRYTWYCPQCMTRMMIDDYSDDWARSFVSCTNCGLALYRHAPGDYRSVQP